MIKRLFKKEQMIGNNKKKMIPRKFELLMKYDYYY